MIKFSFIFLFIQFIALQQVIGICILTHKQTVIVMSFLPRDLAPLIVQCASKDDDLGYHTLHTNQNLLLRFCEDIIADTLFFCHFWWDSKEKSFDAYKETWFDMPFDHSYWIAMSDGIYFFDNHIHQARVKKYDWD